MSQFLPFAVWLGVLATCSFVGACLGVVGRMSVGGGSRRLVIALGLPAFLVGYSFAMYRLLSAFVEVNYSAPAFPSLGATLAASWGLAALVIGALKTPRAVLAGSLIGMASAACAVGPGVPLLAFYLPFLIVEAEVTFVATVAGALAAYHFGGWKRGPGARGHNHCHPGAAPPGANESPAPRPSVRARFSMRVRSLVDSCRAVHRVRLASEALEFDNGT